MKDETTDMYLSFVKQGHFIGSYEHLEWLYQYLVGFYQDQITIDIKHELIDIFERLLDLMRAQNLLNKHCYADQIIFVAQLICSIEIKASNRQKAVFMLLSCLDLLAFKATQLQSKQRWSHLSS